MRAVFLLAVVSIIEKRFTYTKTTTTTGPITTREKPSMRRISRIQDLHRIGRWRPEELSDCAAGGGGCLVSESAFAEGAPRSMTTKWRDYRFSVYDHGENVWQAGKIEPKGIQERTLEVEKVSNS
ncbi:hypothetical protein EJ04DRAFT_363109 [Polyplosphaeria fusca]|uniref:Uncharacterized protein n=1 Tax=Polyplosphaeria fusca TaxID=682080 RepID=A0A9P4QV70_9PLEO|nr:hypothetical protein EJ04DRAFT_363109 [Polyplosphaeria fusca]